MSRTDRVPVVGLCLVALALTLGGCPATSAKVVREASSPPVVDMSLGPADVFDVRVYGEAELSSTYRVSADGTIDFPLIGRIAVRGLTPAQVADELQRRLLTYLKQPQVTVFVREVNSKKVTIYGQVRNPGAISYAEGMTISQAVSMVGGLTAMAARDRARVTRVSVKDGKAETVVVNLKDIAEGTATFYLQPGDEVFVPERVF
ncbi:MAG: polysaccharide biosynthesis/export family protein [Polyangia bacterium]